MNNEEQIKIEIANSLGMAWDRNDEGEIEFIGSQEKHNELDRRMDEWTEQGELPHDEWIRRKYDEEF